MRPAKIKNKTSAGGVVFKRDGSEAKVVLISVRDRTAWTLPKGAIEKGEKREGTAIREVAEETGINARIVTSLGSIAYWFYKRAENTKYHKRVYYYLMEYLSGNLDNRDSEVNEASWFGIEEAIKKVTYNGDREILLRAKEILKRL